MRKWVMDAKLTLKCDECGGLRRGERLPPKEEGEDFEDWLFSNTGGRTRPWDWLQVV